jgi:chromosome segregation ATPase
MDNDIAPLELEWIYDTRTRSLVKTNDENVRFVQETIDIEKDKQTLAGAMSDILKTFGHPKADKFEITLEPTAKRYPTRSLPKVSTQATEISSEIKEMKDTIKFISNEVKSQKRKINELEDERKALKALLGGHDYELSWRKREMDNMNGIISKLYDEVGIIYDLFDIEYGDIDMLKRKAKKVKSIEKNAKVTHSIKKEEEYELLGTCKVCWDNISNIILYPCRCASLCYNCYNAIRDKKKYICPHCQQEFTHHGRVNL